MSDTLDIIETIRGTLRDAYKQATTDDQKQKIKDDLSSLSDLQEDVVLGEFQEAAAEIKALSDALQKIIDNLNGIISNFFIQKLSDIADQNGLGGPAAKLDD